jgi:hypothetical protein
VLDRHTDVIGTLRYALDNVTVLLWLLGTASGPSEQVAALHGSRLRMMLEKTTDTTVRGVVLEAAGTVARSCSPPRSTRRGTRAPPTRSLRADRGRSRRPRGWLRDARGAVAAVLTARRSAAA